METIRPAPQRRHTDRSKAVRGQPPALQHQERSTRKDSRRYEAVIERAPDATIVAGADGRIRLANRQTEILFGYPREELLGQPIEWLIPQRFHQAHLRHRADYAAVPRTRHMGANLQLFGQRRDGSEFPVEVSLAPLDEGGEGLVIASIRDVSELQRVQAANQELRRLQALTDTALAHLNLDDLLPDLLGRVRDVMAVDNAAILLLDAAGQELRIRAALGPEEAVAAQVRVPVGEGFAGRIVASRKPLIVDDLSSFPVVNPLLHEQLRSAAGVPLLLHGQALGVLHIGTTDPHHFTAADVQLLQRVAERVAVAIERGQLSAAERQARRAAEAAQARTEASEARFQRLVEANIIGLFIVEEERIIEANDAFLNLIGYTRADLTAGRLRWPELTPPEYLAVSRRAVQDVVITGSCTPFEKEYIRKDGGRVPLLLGAVLLERHPHRFVTFVLDLTERKRLEQEREEALRHSEEWFRSMANTAPVLLWVADTDALVTFVNDPWLHFTGRRLQQELGNGWTEGVHPDDYQRCMETYLTAFRAHQRFTMEYRLRRADGEYRWVLDNGVPRFTQDGTFEGYIGSAIDVTEREQLKQEREQAEARELAAREVALQLDQFFAMASHDIRSPLTALTGNVALARLRAQRLVAALSALGRKDSELTAPLMQTLDEADASSERLLRLVTLLFDVARARTGTLTLNLAPVDLGELVRDQVAAQQVAAPGRIIELDLPHQPVIVVADADRLGQVLTNYLTNALKYSPDAAPVEVRLEVQAGQAVVSLQDHGSGLPSPEQRRVWELYHRAPDVAVQGSAGAATGSLGLGLYICKRLMELHPGGQVGVKSNVGEGATFWFRLLLAADTGSDQSAT